VTVLAVTVAVEGITDEAVARRLLEHAGHGAGAVYVAGSKSLLDPRLGAYNSAARHGYWFVLRDLDHDAPCAPTLVAAKLPAPAPLMAFRIAVPHVEAWLLGDAEAIAAHLAVAALHIPGDPECLDDAKQSLVNAARRSRSRRTQTAMVPRPGSTAQVGPGYTRRVLEFVQREWRPDVAATRCPSLASCLAALRQWPVDG
jgi:hypothetical protein